ncbi:MAG: hypothetical protein ABIJ52_04670 [Pseudomonadota bacterium]
MTRAVSGATKLKKWQGRKEVRLPALNVIKTISETKKDLFGATNLGDIDAAINYYEPDAKIVSES